MNSFIESLKRLYISQRIDTVKLQNLVQTNKITSEQYTEITGESI